MKTISPVQIVTLLLVIVYYSAFSFSPLHALAPNAKLRSQIIPQPPEDSTDGDVKDTQATACTGIRKQYIPWARLLKRVFGMDIETCSHCQGKLRIIAAIEDPTTIVKILKHLGLPTRAPPRKPARYRDIYDSS